MHRASIKHNSEKINFNELTDVVHKTILSQENLNIQLMIQDLLYKRNVDDESDSNVSRSGKENIQIISENSIIGEENSSYRSNSGLIKETSR
jgi:hypothetical protein